MSLQYMEAVRKSKHVRRSEKAVMLAIANRINDSTGICWPGVKQIAADAGICKKTAMKSIDSLVVKRFLVIEQEASGKRSRRYSINLERLSSGAFSVSSGALRASSGASDAPKPLEPKDRTPKRQANLGLSSTEQSERGRVILFSSKPELTRGGVATVAAPSRPVRIDGKSLPPCPVGGDPDVWVTLEPIHRQTNREWVRRVGAQEVLRLKQERQAKARVAGPQPAQASNG